MSNVLKMIPGPNGDIPLPHDLECEQGLIGAIMLDNAAYMRVSTLIEADDFYDAVHREIFEVIQAFVGAGKLASPITMRNVVGEMDFGDGMTGQQYLATLAAAALPSSTVADYARFLRDMAVQRRLFVSCESMMKRIIAGEVKDSATSMLDDMEEVISESRPSGSSGGGQFQSFESAVNRAVDMASAAYSKGGVLSGLSTGLDNFDEAMGGLQRSDLIIIAGRPGMGKTALATNIAFNVAKDVRERQLNGERPGVIAFFSLEMSADQLAGRILAEHSKVSGWRVRKGQVREAEIEAYAQSGETLKTLQIKIDATPAIALNALKMRARALKKKVGIELIVVDYLQLVKAPGGGRDANRVQEITNITGGLKELAKELDCPVIALSQLSRKVEEREDKRPMLSDLRESGSIEQDADCVVFCYRDAYYLAKSEPPAGTERHNEWTMKMEAAHGRAELIIGKNRHGPERTVHLGFNANLTQFNNDLPEDTRLPDADGKKEKRERPKPLRLIVEATTGLKNMRTLVLTKSIENAGHVDAAARTQKLVLYSDWKEKCCADLLEPDATDAKKASLMEKIVKGLMAPISGHPPQIGRGGSKTASYVWIVS